MWVLIRDPSPHTFRVQINSDDTDQAVGAHTSATFSQAGFTPVCEAMRLSTTRPTRSSAGDDFVNEEQGPSSPLLPSSHPPTHTFTFASNIRLSHTLTLLSLSLPLPLSSNWPSCPSALPQLPQLSALPKREAPQQYRSQVKRKNRLRSQWTSGAQ